MEIKIATIYDNKVEAYGAPMHYISNAELVDSMRQFFEEINTEDVLKVNPIDNELFELGTYNTATAKYDLLDAPKHIGNVHMLIRQIPKSTPAHDILKKSTELSNDIFKAQKSIEKEVN